MPTEAQLKARRHRTLHKERADRRIVRRLQLQIHKLHARHLAQTKRIKALKGQGGVHAGVTWALQQVGTGEHPNGSNRGPKVDQWSEAAIGFSGVAWCQTFADAVLVHGGGIQLKSGYTVQVIEWARAGQYGLHEVPVSQRRPGDFVYFKFPGVSHDLADHVGVDIGGGKTVEGNTSPTSSGSQNSGGCVAVKNRGNGYVVAVVRPTY